MIMIKPHAYEYLVMAILAVMTLGYYLDSGFAPALILGGFTALVCMIFCGIFRAAKK